MTVSVTDDPTRVVISENGIAGAPGANGADGTGFNSIRKLLLDNPMTWIYKANNLVRNLSNVLTVDRPVGGNYTDIYGDVIAALPDEPREELKGWLIDSTETHSFDVYNNVPDINNGFSLFLYLGSYSEGAATQKILTIPAISGELFSVGTDGSGNWVASVQGDDLVTYQATTTISATSASDQFIAVNYSAGTLTININNSLEGSVTLPTGTAIDIDSEGAVTIDGNFTTNVKSLIINPFTLNDEEIEYLNT